jgi:AraC-like DNA-binding protein
MQIAMKNKKLDSNKSDFQIEIDESRDWARRKTGFLPDGAYFFEDGLDSEGVNTTRVITCTAWLFEIYEMQSGELFFINGEKEICANFKRIGVFYPPFSISEPGFKNVKARLRGIASTESLPEEFKVVPIFFEVDFKQIPASAAQVIEILHSSRKRQSIEINPKASFLSLKAKKLIDEHYLVYPSIARVAAKIGVTHEHLSRQFKRDFGLSPSAYLHQLRLADAPLLLAKGEEIADVSQDLGYNDLSRFYKQFRKSTKTSPGVCQTMMKPSRD